MDQCKNRNLFGCLSCGRDWWGCSGGGDYDFNDLILIFLIDKNPCMAKKIFLEKQCSDFDMLDATSKYLLLTDSLDLDPCELEDQISTSYSGISERLKALSYLRI